MVTVQEAFTRAKDYAREVLGDMPYTLEEVEQDSYKGRQVWRITLGFPKRRPSAPDLVRSLGAALPLEYKTFLVDATTGELMTDFERFDRNVRSRGVLIDTNLLASAVGRWLR